MCFGFFDYLIHASAYSSLQRGCRVQVYGGFPLRSDASVGYRSFNVKPVLEDKSVQLSLIHI